MVHVPYKGDVPALAKAVPGFQARTRVGFFAPARTPPAIFAKIHADIAHVMQQPAVRTRFQDFGAAIGGNPPAAFAAYIRSEVELWQPVVRASGAKVE